MSPFSDHTSNYRNGVRTWCRCRKGGSREEIEAEIEGARQELLIPVDKTVNEAIDAAGVQAVRIGTTGGDTLSVNNLFDIPVKDIVAASRKPL